MKKLLLLLAPFIVGVTVILMLYYVVERATDLRYDPVYQMHKRHEAQAQDLNARMKSVEAVIDSLRRSKLALDTVRQIDTLSRKTKKGR